MQSSKVVPGDKVTFRVSYDGYFKKLKGYELTVAKRIPNEDGGGDWLILAEIDEVHLVRLSNFRKVRVKQ